ncbi:unnamed protein product [Merluccius merluccius]
MEANREEKVRKDIWLSNHVAGITGSRWFSAVIRLVVLLDVLLSALETNRDLRLRLGHVSFQVADKLFLGVYAAELLLKVYVEPVRFWKSWQNVFVAALLVMCVLHMFRDPGAVGYLELVHSWRCLRLIGGSSVPLLREFFLAYYSATKSALEILCLILLLVFVFAVIGTQCFVDSGSDHWGDLGSAFFALFSMVIVDGWTGFQQNLDQLVGGHTRVFTIVFLIMGYFTFLNMYSSVVVTEIHSTMEHFERIRRVERLRSEALKKHTLGQKYKEEERRELHQRRARDNDHFRQMVSSFKSSLRPDDLTVTEDPCASLTFANAYLISLEDQTRTARELQRVYGDVAAMLDKMEEEKRVGEL